MEPMNTVRLMSPRQARTRMMLRQFAIRLTPYIGFAIRLFLALVFLRSAWAKFNQPLDFLADIYSYRVVGPLVGRALAAVIPAIELAVSACLLFNIYQGSAFLIAFGLLATFTGAQLWAISQDLSIVCSCFGSTSDSMLVSYGTVSRTVFMGFCAAIGFLSWMNGRVIFVSS